MESAGGSGGSVAPGPHPPAAVTTASSLVFWSPTLGPQASRTHASHWHSLPALRSLHLNDLKPGRATIKVSTADRDPASP